MTLAAVVTPQHGPTPSTRPVAIWLLLCCAMIFAMVIIGGVTRLTESGLSITEWQPVAGIVPPLSEAAWLEAFRKYQAIPEYQLVNKDMTLAEFKTIFWWEWAHRFWGRLIGAVFLLPFLWFLASGRVRGPLAWRLGGLFVLGGLQGALGWYMVQSGLVDRTDVSPYRLTAHLVLAIAIYAWAFWLALDLLRGAARPAPMRTISLMLAGLVLLAIASGGFVAGLNAGRTYNTFPLMDGRLVPAGYLDLAPWWANLFENVAAVQFNHRCLGIATVLASIAFWLKAQRAGGGPVHAVAAMAALQAALGIATLLLWVPIPLAALHQAGALTLLTLVLWSAHRLGGVTPGAGAAAAPRPRRS